MNDGKSNIANTYLEHRSSLINQKIKYVMSLADLKSIFCLKTPKPSRRDQNSTPNKYSELHSQQIFILSTSVGPTSYHNFKKVTDLLKENLFCSQF